MLPRIASADASISFDLIIPSLMAANQKQVIRLVAHELAKKIGINERILADRISEKEKESPSAMGDGIAITHLQMGSLQESINVFIRMKTPVAYGAPDNKDVDIICFLLTPEREGASYLRTLARTSRILKNPQTLLKLRSAQDEKAIQMVLGQTAVSSIAA